MSRRCRTASEGLAKPVPEPDNGVMLQRDAGCPEPDNAVTLGPDAGVN